MNGIGAGRAATEQVAQRINAAATLLASSVSTAQAIRQLAQRYGLSARQARRYVEQARQSGAVDIPAAKTVLTVKVRVDLVDRIRRHAGQSGQLLSTTVSLALEQFLNRVAVEARPPGPCGRH